MALKNCLGYVKIIPATCSYLYALMLNLTSSIRNKPYYFVINTFGILYSNYFYTYKVKSAVLEFDITI